MSLWYIWPGLWSNFYFTTKGYGHRVSVLMKCDKYLQWAVFPVLFQLLTKVIFIQWGCRVFYNVFMLMKAFTQRHQNIKYFVTFVKRPFVSHLGLFFCLHQCNLVSDSSRVQTNAEFCAKLKICRQVFKSVIQVQYYVYPLQLWRLFSQDVKTYISNKGCPLKFSLAFLINIPLTSCTVNLIFEFIVS